jgi:O-antigen ligase
VLPLNPLQNSAGEMRWALLAQMAAVVIPSMGLAAAGDAELAARCFYVLLGAVLGLRILRKDPTGYAAILVGVSPALLLFRQVWLYSIVIVLFAVGLALWFAVKPQEVAKLFKQHLLSAFLVLSFAYWWISFLRAEDSSALGIAIRLAPNSRLLELVFSVLLVVLLGGRRSYLRAAMAGVAVTVLATALGLAPHSGVRLGQAEIGVTSMGNPILLGLASALVVLMSLANRGEGLVSGRAGFLRWPWMAISTIVLVLSTSRGSWVVLLAGLAVMFAFAQRDRARIAGAVTAGAAVIVLLIAAGLADPAIEYFDRATSSERSLAQKTTGRSDQWQKFPQVFAASPVWGHGPGSGASSYTAVSGRDLVWHSLYLHVGAETGLIGLLCLAVILCGLLARGIRHARLTGEVTPLVGSVCFATIGISVTGFDAVSGIYLGWGFLGMNLAGLRVIRKSWRVTVLEAAPAQAAETVSR